MSRFRKKRASFFSNLPAIIHISDSKEVIIRGDNKSVVENYSRR